MDVCFTIYELPRYLFVSFVSAKTVDKREEELRKCMYVSRISTFGGYVSSTKRFVLKRSRTCLAIFVGYDKRVVKE